jgi:hypothetical protein
MSVNRPFEFDEGGWQQLRGVIRSNVVEHIAHKVARDASRVAPIGPEDPKHPHEHLKDSIDVEIVDDFTALIGSDKEYAASVEMGARPHLIPNAFGHGQTVHHPGNPAQPYLRPALYAPHDARGE